jgi:hypothetical protein
MVVSGAVVTVRGASPRLGVEGDLEHLTRPEDEEDSVSVVQRPKVLWRKTFR